MKKKSKKNTDKKKQFPAIEYRMLAWSKNNDYTMIARGRQICGNCEHIGASDRECPSMYRCQISGKANPLDHECDVETGATISLI